MGSGVTTGGTERESTFHAGSEWLFVKVYSGIVFQDALLLRAIAPEARSQQVAGVVDGWFFVRYRDPDWHLRVRLHGSGAGLLDSALPKLCRRLVASPWTEVVRRIDVSSYQREISRYGGPAAILAAERLFCADSTSVMEVLRLLDLNGKLDGSKRWEAALAGLDMLFCDIGLTLEERRLIVKRAYRSLLDEFDWRGDLGTLVGLKCRQLYRQAHAAITAGRGGGHADADLLACVNALRLRLGDFERLADVLDVSDRARVAASLGHMFVNRMIARGPRAHELVLYALLNRLYDTEWAGNRLRPPARDPTLHMSAAPPSQANAGGET